MIFSERPLLHDFTIALTLDTYLAFALSSLSKTKIKRFKRLRNVFTERGDVGIVATNAYAVDHESRFCAVFDKLSRVNHSCRPNAERKWDSVLEVEKVYALREIKSGEEIIVSYLAGLDGLGLGERRELLMKGWRFECHCERCVEGRETRV